MTATIHVTRPSEAETCWVVRDRVHFMGALDGTDLRVLEVEVPPGSGTPPHVHDSPEIFRVLEGEIIFGLFAEGPPQQSRAPAGTVVTVPSRHPHNYRNDGPAPARMLVIVDRTMEAFFREVGKTDTPPPGPPGAAEMAAVLAACARHRITLLGGPPS